MRRLAFSAIPLLIIQLSTGVGAIANHFSSTCYLCSCFVQYSDRDVKASLRPYAIAFNPYDSTEDRCLATCLRDERCKAAVYGLVGGRKVFACEFYDSIPEPRFNVQYTPHVNVYLRRAVCRKRLETFPPVEMVEEKDDESQKRRSKVDKLSRAFNPFHG